MPLHHVYWFAFYNPAAPSVRYRAIYPLKKMTEVYGVSYKFAYPSYRPDRIWHFLRMYFEAFLFPKENAIIVFQEIYTNRIYGNMLKLLLYFRRGISVYDMDDAENERYPAQVFDYFISKAKYCSCGSQALRNYATAKGTESSLLSSPVIDHVHIKQERNSIFRVGWVGFYNTHRQSLQQLFFPCLKQLAFDIELVMLGVNKPKQREELLNEAKRWPRVQLSMPANTNWMDEDALYQQIATFDVGIAPLLNTAMNRSKSAFKMKQYLSCGVPVLASSVGENNRFLEDGKNGYFCNMPEDYLFRINQLKHMAEQCYNALSLDARQSQSQFSMEGFASGFIAMASRLV